MTTKKLLSGFKNNDLLTEAFTHRSYLNESKDPVPSNERMEFLGDAVLEILISEYLFYKYPAYPEGKLTLLRSSIVRTETLAKAATTLKLGEQLKLSKGEEAHGGRNNQSILANTYEAVLGALYLDRGFEASKEFVDQTLVPYIDDIVANKSYRDAKSYLQEIVQDQFKVTPTYKVLHEEGPDHQKVFTVGVFIGDKEIGAGTGKSKQIAQSKAAKQALTSLAKD